MFALYIVKNTILFSILLFVALFITESCSSHKKEPKVSPDALIYKIDTSDRAGHRKGKKPPIINITDTIALRQIILCMKDSASTSERIGIKLTNIYDKVLRDFIRSKNLSNTGSKIAWFKTSSSPFFFEAGLPVNKVPPKLPKNIFVKQIGGDSAVIAHFYGPYELTYEGYGALREWLHDNNKKASGAPYEIYITDPIDNKGRAADPYRVQTDIVFPHH